MPHLAFMQALMKNWVTRNIFYSFTDSNVGVELCIRRRFTIAEVNAGADILPALDTSFKYRMIDAMMVAVGGAAGAATTVDITATLAAASRKLLAVAIAALTQSAVVRAGAANATVLADGASFTANDANTAVRIGVTGAPLTTVTHIDVVLCYVIEKV